jgi:PAS domain S-box-containing protein
LTNLALAISIYSPANRRRLLLLAAALAVGIAVLDWRTETYLSLGFLYLFPIMLASGFLSRVQIVSAAIVCAILQEVFSNLPPADAVPRLVMASAGFIGTGLFLHELVLKRRLEIAHLNELESQMKLRLEAEEQLQILVNSSPAAILTIDAEGRVLLANEAAQMVLGVAGQPLAGQPIQRYLPALLAALQSKRSQAFRTTMHCRGQRANGEAFLAGVWFSTYDTASGLRLAAIIVDLSDDLRDREDLSLDYLLKNTRILMGAVSHEIRNLCGAALVVHQNLARVKALEGNVDFEALGSLIQGLEKLSSMELGEGGTADRTPCVTDLGAVLDELRVLLDSAYADEQIELSWETAESLPLVWADRYGLLQVFLNLAKNSRRAMQDAPEKRLRIVAAWEDGEVVVRFEDTGPGIADTRNLFRPFQRDAQSTGLGLYVSRAILKSFGGDLVHETRAAGCSFCVKLQPAQTRAGAVHV